MNYSYVDSFYFVHHCTCITFFLNLYHQFLQSEQVDIRLEAVHLIGRLLALSNLHFGQENKAVFTEFLRRFSDKSAEVRIAAIDAAKACYMDKSSGDEAREILCTSAYMAYSSL